MICGSLANACWQQTPLNYHTHVQTANERDDCTHNEFNNHVYDLPWNRKYHIARNFRWVQIFVVFVD